MTGQKFQALINKPTLPERLQHINDLFFDLSGSRSQACCGIGRIPISEIKAYFEMKSFDEEESAYYLKFILHMDTVYVTHFSKKVR